VVVIISPQSDHYSVNGPRGVHANYRISISEHFLKLRNRIWIADITERDSYVSPEPASTYPTGCRRGDQAVELRLGS
jgi:hypothetical protein